MTQVQSGVGSKTTGDQLTAAQFNALNQTSNNANAVDAETRLNALEASSPGSVLFDTPTEGGELTAINTEYDPDTNGSDTFTLPTPSSALNGKERWMYRTGGASNFTTITGNICDKVSGSRVIGLVDEHIAFKCNGSTWLESGHSTLAFATLSQVSSASFAVTTSYTKFTGWDTVIFSTPGRLIADLTDNIIDVLDFDGVVDGYKLDCTLSFEYTNNKVVTAQIAVDGVPVSTPVTVNSLGSNKPVTIVIDQAIGVLAEGEISLLILSETAGNITSLTGRFTASRIKG